MLHRFVAQRVRGTAVEACHRVRNHLQVHDLREFLAPGFAKWWLPDRYEFVAEIPKTSVGKFLKTELRQQYAKEPATP